MATEQAEQKTGAVLKTGHVGLNVSDLEKSEGFYQRVFSFEVVLKSEEVGRRFVFLGDGERLVLTLWEQVLDRGNVRFEAGRPGLHHLSFEASSVEEVGRYEERLEEESARLLYDGIVPHGEGADSGGIFFEDPDGIRLEIYSPTGAGGHEAPHGDAPTCGFF